MATSWNDPTSAAPETVTFSTVGDDGAGELAGGGEGAVGAVELAPLCPVHAATAMETAAKKAASVARFILELPYLV